MNIAEKIEKIQKQPEHIRMRWVWGMTAVSMLFILLLWFVSIGAKNHNDQQNFSDEQKVLMEEFGQQKKSLEDTANSFKDTYQRSMENLPRENSEIAPQ